MKLPLPPPTRYDLLVRYLLPKAGALLFHWLLRKTPEQVRLERWLPTQLTLPGVPERLCDGIAELLDLEKGASRSRRCWRCRRSPTSPCRGDSCWPVDWFG